MPNTLILILDRGVISSTVKHFDGLPPELTEGQDTRKEMGAPLFLTIMEMDSGIFLHRFDGEGRCVGDTWHTSVEEARDQARFEYNCDDNTWKSIPDHIAYEQFPEYGLALIRAN